MRIFITEETEGIDLEIAKSQYKKLKQLQSSFKLINKNDKSEIQYAKDKIKEVRESLKNMIYKKYRVNLKSNMYYKYFEFATQPTAKDIRDCKQKFIQAIKVKRSSLRREERVTKSFLGFSYTTIGGVFVKGNEIVAIGKSYDPVMRIQQSKKPHPSVKANYVGIELELVCSISRTDLEKEFINKGLAGYIKLHGDGSIRTESSGQQPIEVTLMCREEDVRRVVTDVCSVLNTIKVQAFVNNSCGMHVHLDSRNRDPEILYHNLVQVLPMLKRMVPLTRTESPEGRQYCGMNVTNDFNSMASASNGRRYQAVNPEAYGKYKTIEVRLHSGTTNAAKIINWVSILTKVANLSVKMSHTIDNSRDFHNMFNDASSKLLHYIDKRTELFTGPDKGKADTRGDHFYINDYEIAI